jgi:hypothetical protein
MNQEQVHDDLSLEEIEGDAWGDPPVDATRLMTTVYQLRREPIGALEAEDLRVLISQQEGLEILVPRALAQLSQDPLLEGDFYPGDVLVAVLRAPHSYWSEHPAELATLRNIIDSIEDIDPDLQGDIDAFRAAVGP